MSKTAAFVAIAIGMMIGVLRTITNQEKRIKVLETQLAQKP